MASNRTFAFRITAEGVDEIRQKLTALGADGVRAFETIRAAAPQLQTAMERATAAAEQARRQLAQPVATGVAPALRETADAVAQIGRETGRATGLAALTGGMQQLGQVANENERRVKGVVGTLRDLFGTVQLMGPAFGGALAPIASLAGLVGNVGDAFGILGAILRRHPLILAASAIVGLVGIFGGLNAATDLLSSSQGRYNQALAQGNALLQGANEEAARAATRAREQSIATLRAAEAEQQAIVVARTAAAARERQLAERAAPAYGPPTRLQAPELAARVARAEAFEASAAEARAQASLLTDRIRGLNEQNQIAASAFTGAAAGAATFADALSRLRDAADPSRAALRGYGQESQLLADLLERNLIAVDEYNVHLEAAMRRRDEALRGQARGADPGGAAIDDQRAANDGLRAQIALTADASQSLERLSAVQEASNRLREAGTRATADHRDALAREIEAHRDLERTLEATRNARQAVDEALRAATGQAAAQAEAQQNAARMAARAAALMIEADLALVRSHQAVIEATIGVSTSIERQIGVMTRALAAMRQMAQTGVAPPAAEGAGAARGNAPIGKNQDRGGGGARQDVVRETREERQVLEEVVRAYRDGRVAAADLNRELEIANRLRQAGRDLTPVQRQALEDEIRMTAELRDMIAQVQRKRQEAERAAQDAQREQRREIEQTAQAISKSLTGAFEDAALRGRSLREVLAGLLMDLARIAIQAALLRPLGDWLSNTIGGWLGGAGVGGGASAGAALAQGGVMSNGELMRFAAGGVVDRPTLFNMSRGRTGLMGEAGPEAILPLRRTPNGNLGVVAMGAGGGAGGAVNITINVSVASSSGDERQDQAYAEKIAMAIEARMESKIDARIAHAQRHGGLANSRFG